MLALALGLLAASTATSTVPVVELITMGPGPDLYSYWGHAALRVVDPMQHRDLVYNFGSVDFSDGFFVRMLRGQVDAFIGVSRYQDTLRAYVGEDRTFTRRTLALTPAARLALAQTLAAKNGPAASYRYHHFLDNCSTRVAELIDQASGGRLSAGRTVSAGASFRERAMAQLAPHPLTAVAVDLCLAHGLDQPITEFQATFLPDELGRQLDAREGMVGSKDVVHRGPAVQEWSSPWIAIDLLLGGPLLLLLLFRFRLGLWVYGILAGTVGTLLLILWLGTTYDFVARNYNILLFPPTHLALVALGSRPALLRPYAAGVLGIGLLLLLLGGLGRLGQDLSGPLSLALPLQVALLWGAWRAAQRVSTSPE